MKNANDIIAKTSNEMMYYKQLSYLHRASCIAYVILCIFAYCISLFFSMEKTYNSYNKIRYYIRGKEGRI